ncbi:hypothetical protein SISNIDRAFT_505651 [Sistotremastrum niveocremeum HHB9708]|uniref:Uncharacterized protein n=1 Tax=Sistotremastrum niveocremeum HHB9708 TaxID=1314777 RepID=A0A164UX69_9AGAM|nr:hypothetical protein SISNIDRAFT_505651 [Sistotremastrum niveocremeum HHB9708]
MVQGSRCTPEALLHPWYARVSPFVEKASHQDFLKATVRVSTSGLKLSALLEDSFNFSRYYKTLEEVLTVLPYFTPVLLVAVANLFSLSLRPLGYLAQTHTTRTLYFETLEGDGSMRNRALRNWLIDGLRDPDKRKAPFVITAEFLQAQEIGNSEFRLASAAVLLLAILLYVGARNQARAGHNPATDTLFPYPPLLPSDDIGGTLSSVWARCPGWGTPNIGRA